MLSCGVIGEGGKPALVLLHGFGGSGRHFGPLAGALGGPARLYLPDLPGHGGSAGVDGKRHARAAGDAVLATLDEAGCRDFHLAGFSFGGAVAALVALGAPDRVRSLTLLAPGGFGPEIAADTLRRFAAARTPDALRAALRDMGGPGYAPAAGEIEALAQERSDERLHTELAAIAAAITRDGRQGVIPRSDLARIACPVRVLWGTADPVLPVSQSRDLPPQFELRLIEGAGHMLVDEARDAVIDALLDSLKA